MKKHVTMLLASAMVLFLLSGCGPKSATTPTQAPTQASPPTAAPTETAGGSVKTGLGVISSLSGSEDAGEAEGVAEMDSTVVAVTVGPDGKIIGCVIDQVQTKVKFDSTGKITTPPNTEVPTKRELGDSYGMKARSDIGKEWYEQASAFADYVVGKTVEQIKGIAVDEAGHATGSDLTSSVTISISGFISGLEKAVGNATDIGAKDSDKLSVGVTTNLTKLTNADTSAGLIEVGSTYVAATTDANGIITSCIIDSSQGKVSFDNTGKITSDITAAPQTKNELGDSYGMKAKSGIGKEWNEQAAAFASYVAGKTASDVQGIAVDEQGHATGEDLTSSVTVSIGDFQKALAKALGSNS